MKIIGLIVLVLILMAACLDKGVCIVINGEMSCMKIIEGK